MIFRLNLSWYRFTHFAFCLLTFLVLSLHSSFLPRTVLAESITAVGSEGLSASTHINITIIIPERIDIKIPARSVDLIITTEKDILILVRFPFAKEQLMALRVGMVVEEGDSLIQAVEDVIRGRMRGA